VPDGRVVLVGAGPGDPELITLRGLKWLRRAEVVVYDHLAAAELLDEAPAGTLQIFAGKSAGRHCLEQSAINAVLIHHAQAGRLVVRLKGGDPFVFGRGGEEAEVLRRAGIKFEVVPGITAGIAAAAYAGIPVTHREAASAVAFVTGHEDPAKPESALDWRALAAFPGTLVVYMGVRQLRAISEQLLAGGRSADEPAALVQRGTFPDQRTLSATLGTIAERASAERFRAPSIALFGPVAALREQLQWFERRPLAGVTVAVTRARAQSSGLAARLRGLGAAVVEAPAILIAPIDGPAPELEPHDLLCVTSPNGVHLLFDRLARAGRDARALAGIRVAAIGPGTAAALREHGVIADVVPERFVAEGLVEALAGVPVRSALIARAAQARDVLPDALRERGAAVEVLALYETVAEPLDEAQLEAVRTADYVTFTSSSTVEFFFDALGDGSGLAARLVSIGPVTSASLRGRGHEPDVEAASHDIDGLVGALLADVEARA
jgi:uroporphyrinogen III methyltransferase/synthase